MAAPALSLAVGGAAAYSLLAPARHDCRAVPEYPPPAIGGEGGEEVREPEAAEQLGGALDLRRKAQIVWAKPTDHAGEVVTLLQKDFDINRTIFKGIPEWLKPLQAAKIGITLFWTDEAAARISQAFSRVPQAPRYDQALVDFMLNDCDFAVEHADGSFMDHLRFCYEYSHAHYPQRSPRVLLLHSIMGVGTNIFPMEASKIPQLQDLVTPFEFEQISMFPSMLRVFYHGPLRFELEAMSAEKLRTLQSIECFRVIDNAKLVMDADAFWIQLNYQLIHLLDFLPASSWALHAGDNFLDNFTAMYEILRKAGKLECHIDFDIREAKSTSEGQPFSLGGFLRGKLPTSVQLAMVRRQIAGFSGKIGHSLEYRLNFRQDSRL